MKTVSQDQADLDDIHQTATDLAAVIETRESLEASLKATKKSEAFLREKLDLQTGVKQEQRPLFEENES